MTTVVDKPPRARPAAMPAALVLALGLVVLGGVAVRDLVVAQGWAKGTAWSQSVLSAFDGLTASTAVVAGGIAAGSVGLLLMWLAIRPGRRTHLRASCAADVWLSPRSLAALAAAVADRAPGVVGAKATRVTRRRVVVDVVTSQEPTAVADAVQSALDETVSGLTDARITVRTKAIPQ